MYMYYTDNNIHEMTTSLLYTYQVWKQILVWVLRLWLEQNLEVSVPLLISEEKNTVCYSFHKWVQKREGLRNESVTITCRNTGHPDLVLSGEWAIGSEL